jgi:16S rRNA (guanine966-N2)-methyltransferase
MRITGGAFRSRILRAPKGDSTRPTTDRVREALFSILESRGMFKRGARVLDLYGGTGALAFEALSRGAESAVIVDHDRAAISCVRENAKALGVEARTRIFSISAKAALTKVRDESFHLAILDPPYVRVTERDFAGELDSVAALLTPDGWLILEHGKRDKAPDAASLRWQGTRRYGDTHVSFAQRVDALDVEVPETNEKEAAHANQNEKLEAIGDGNIDE